MLGRALCVVSGGPDTHRGKCQQDHVGDGPPKSTSARSQGRAAPAIALRPPPSFSKSVRSPMLPCTCKESSLRRSACLAHTSASFEQNKNTCVQDGIYHWCHIRSGGIHPRSTIVGVVAVGPSLKAGQPAPRRAGGKVLMCWCLQQEASSSIVEIPQRQALVASGHWRRRARRYL
nr:unnamed protein product [Digitaria exilis]